MTLAPVAERFGSGAITTCSVAAGDRTMFSREGYNVILLYNDRVTELYGTP